MSEQAQALADRFEQATGALLAALTACSEDDWCKQAGSDARPVGVIAHHIASSHALVLGLAQAVAAGRPLPALTWEMVHPGQCPARGAAGGLYQSGDARAVATEQRRSGTGHSQDAQRTARAPVPGSLAGTSPPNGSLTCT